MSGCSRSELRFRRKWAALKSAVSERRRNDGRDKLPTLVDIAWQVVFRVGLPCGDEARSVAWGGRIDRVFLFVFATR
jgi:hypothetical protein